MIKYTYFLIDFFTIFIPFVFSFHPKLNFYKTWKSVFPAIFITGFIFLCWDVYFTHKNVWGFNDEYLIGINLLNLPIEEVLFFLCIPYSCLFTFYCIRLYYKDLISLKTESKITLTLILSLLIFGFIFFEKKYTSSTFISFAILLSFAKYILKIRWLGDFYAIWALLLLPFFIVNGILTGTGLESPVVWYNNDQIIGRRIFTIPIEDIFYGMELILLNLLIYLYTNKNRKNILLWNQL